MKIESIAEMRLLVPLSRRLGKLGKWTLLVTK